MARQHEDPGQRSTLTKEQKTGFVFLLVFALLTVSLGFLQMRNTIYNPFVINAESNGADIELAYDDNVRLQQIDTDQDGLTDFEEIHFYETSAYIPDTDSDGVEDGDEIDRGSDPLCPEGQECGVGTDASQGDVVLEGGQGSEGVTAPFGASLDEPEFPQWALEELEAFASAQADSPVVGSGNPAEGTTADDLESIINNPDLLRALLLSTGQLTEEQLQGVDDATIIAIAEELLAEQQGSTDESLESLRISPSTTP